MPGHLAGMNIFRPPGLKKHARPPGRHKHILASQLEKTYLDRPAGTNIFQLFKHVPAATNVLQPSCRNKHFPAALLEHLGRPAGTNLYQPPCRNKHFSVVLPKQTCPGRPAGTYIFRPSCRKNGSRPPGRTYIFRPSCRNNHVPAARPEHTNFG